MISWKVWIVMIVAFISRPFMVSRRATYYKDDIFGLRIVVTGASSGIGEQIAYQLAENGARLVITARNDTKLQQVVNRCKKIGSPEVHYIAVSMYSYENASLVIQKALSKFGGIDMLVLNHLGQTYFGGYRKNVTDVEQLLMSNTLTHAHMASISLTYLKESKGRIAVVSSAVGIVGAPFVIPYGTTKFALNGFFTGLRHELTYNTSEISVSINHIGYIATDTALRFRKYLYQKPASKYECAAEIIRGAMAREDDVYFPYELRWVPLLKSIFPSYINRVVRENYHDVY